MDRWGGIPRWTVEKISSNDQSKLMAAVDQCSIQLVLESMRGLAAHPTISHKILHICASEDTLKRTCIQWASPWVEQQVMLRACERESLAVQLFVRSAGGIPEIAGFRGNLLEPICHAKMMKGGMFKIRNLDNGKEETVTFSNTMPNLEYFKDVSDISSSNGVYFRPVSKCLPAIDALMQPNILLQMTVSQKHPVVAHGLLQALSALTDADNARLYFVVPENEYATFSKQGIKNIKKMSGENKALLRSVQQFALMVEL
jgi:hypothetical protein